jgi:hypothetical protein
MISSYNSCTQEDWAMKSRNKHQENTHVEFKDDRFDRNWIETESYNRSSHDWWKDSW